MRINCWLDENGRLTHETDMKGDIKNTISAKRKTLYGVSKGLVMYTSKTENEFIVRYPATGVIFNAPGYRKIWGGMGMGVEIFTFDPSTGTWTNESKNVGGFDWDADMGPFCEYFGA